MKDELFGLWKSMFLPLFIIFGLLQVWLFYSTDFYSIPSLIGHSFFCLCYVIMLSPLVKLLRK